MPLRIKSREEAQEVWAQFDKKYQHLGQNEGPIKIIYPPRKVGEHEEKIFLSGEDAARKIQRTWRKKTSCDTLVPVRPIANHPGYNHLVNQRT